MVKPGKKKGKKSGTQRRRKSEGPDIPWKEALLAYEWVAITCSTFLACALILICVQARPILPVRC